MIKALILAAVTAALLHPALADPNEQQKLQVAATNFAARGEIDAYIARIEPNYSWKRVPARQDTGGLPVGLDLLAARLTVGVTTQELTLVSQEWQGAPWTHRVQVFRPAKLRFPNTTLLYVPYGSGSAIETILGQMLANLTGAVVVNLFDVPNQPLYGKREDELIAHTFEKYLETGDATWPLLFPMTKSVVKAMDAVQEYSEQEWGQPVTRFVVTGASKRGWTTWLAGVADKRVIGIMPQVYDNLNLPAQMPYQLASFGEYSEQISDYTRRGFQDQMQTSRGAALTAMVDPYTYRDRLTMPKLIINGTNDPYWPVDALNLYCNDLPEPVNVMLVPNAGHDLGGQAQLPALIGTAVTWFRTVAAGQDLPKVELLAEVPVAPDQARRFVLTASETPKIIAVRLWLARSATRDFRKAHWQAMPMTAIAGGAYAAEVKPADAGMEYSAVFGEVEMAGIKSIVTLPMRLSSLMVVWHHQER